MSQATHYLAASFAKGPFADVSRSNIDTPLDTTDTENNRVESMPDLAAGDSFDLVIYCFQNYQDSKAKHDFGAAATATLQIKRANSAEEGASLDLAGTVTQVGGTGEYYKVTFSVPADAIGTYYANQSCLLYAIVTNGTEKRTLLIPTSVLSLDGDSTASLQSSDLPVSTHRYVCQPTAPDANTDNTQGFSVGDYIYHWVPATHALLYRCDNNSTAAAVWTGMQNADVTLHNRPDDKSGIVCYNVDLSAGDGAIFLPNAQSDGSIIILNIVEATNALAVSGQVWGAGNITLDTLTTAWLHYYAADNIWLNMNFSVVVE